MSETAVSAQKDVIIGLQKRVIDIQEQHIERTETVVGQQVRDTTMGYWQAIRCRR